MERERGENMRMLQGFADRLGNILRVVCGPNEDTGGGDGWRAQPWVTEIDNSSVALGNAALLAKARIDAEK